MINILEAKIVRTLKLIDILFPTRTPLSLSQISSSLNVSESTVISDINYLNSTYSDYISIERQNFSKVKLENTSSSDINYVKYMIVNHSKNVQLLTELLLNPFKQIKYYSNILNMSSSYIYKAIDQINLSLKPFRIEIRSANKNYFIDSEFEVLLRKLFTVFLAETKSYTLDNIFENYQYVKFEEYDFNSDVHLNISLFKTYYFSFIYLSKKREDQGFHMFKLENDSGFKQLIADDQSIIDSLTYSPFKKNLFFYNRKFFDLYDYLLDLSNEDKEEAILFLELIIRIYENEISHQIPPSLFFHKLDSFYLELKQKKHIYLPIQDIINNISEIIHTDLTNYRVILSYILFVHFPNFITLGQRKEIFIISELSYSHAKFLSAFFSNRFENSFNFIAVNTFRNTHDLKESDFFITNNPNLSFNNKIIINDYPTQNDIEQVKKRISLIYQ